MYQLRHFLAVKTHGSISKAAEAINVSQPAVTRSIKKLELDLGVKLLQRVAGGMRPTEIGDVFATHAQGILQQTKRVAEDVDAIKEGRSGRVVLGISSDNVQSYILPELLKRWVEQEVQGRLFIVRTSPLDIVPKITEAEIDIGFCAILGSGYGSDTNIEVLLNDRMYVWARKDHPITRNNNVAIDDLSRLEWAFMGVSRSPVEFVDAHFGAKGVHSPRIALQSTSISVLRDAILHTDLIGMLPENYVRELAADGALVKLPFPGLEVRENIGLVTLNSRPLTNAQDKLCQIIREICSEIPASSSN